MGSCCEVCPVLVGDAAAHLLPGGPDRERLVRETLGPLQPGSLHTSLGTAVGKMSLNTLTPRLTLLLSL